MYRRAVFVEAEVDGVRYYFCCANCRAKFLKGPQAHLVHS